MQAGKIGRTRVNPIHSNPPAMKTCLTPALILAAVLSTSASLPAFASTKDERAIAYPTSSVTAQSQYGNRQIIRGATRDEVQAVLDCPNRMLSPDVWLYYGFSADLKEANDHGCRTMMITFAEGRVVDMKFINKPAAAVIAAKVKSNSATRYVAKK